MTNFFKLFLFPFALLYDLVTRVRNLLFDIGIFKTYPPPVFSIGVGNLSVGGTGKTPFIAYLIENLSDKKLAVLSRGYGRKTKGYKEVMLSDTAETVGDEIQMLSQRYKTKVNFFVSENRKEGVLKLLEAYPETEIILFDDVFQHRWVKPSLNILLNTFAEPFFADYLLPYGKLREARKGANRADMILITKSNSTSLKSVKASFIEKISGLSLQEISMFFTFQHFMLPTNTFGKTLDTGGNVNVLSALANNKIFQEVVKEDFNVLESFEYKDHYSYARKDIDLILGSEKSVPIITTEKDFAKLENLLTKSEKSIFHILKLKTKFVDKEDEFLRNVKAAFEAYQENK